VAQKSKTLRKFIFKDSKKGIDLLLGENLRNQQLKEISGNEEKTMTESEKLIEKRLKVSLASLGISALGNMIYFPLNLLSIPGLLYVTSPIFRNAYQALFTEKKVRIHTLTSFMLVSCIIVDGIASVDQQILTGESQPEDKKTEYGRSLYYSGDHGVPTKKMA